MADFNAQIPSRIAVFVTQASPSNNKRRFFGAKKESRL
jgi:hypothetical protein